MKIKNLFFAAVSCFLAACGGGGYADATYDSLIPMQLYGRYRGGNYVYVNPDNGAIMFDGHEFSRADFFSCGLAAITDGERSGYIDEKNNLVIDAKAMNLSKFMGFSDGCAIGEVMDSGGYRYVVINTKGEIVAQLDYYQWDYVFNFKDGYSVWRIKDGNGFGLMDTKGQMRIVEGYEACMYPSHGLICVRPYGSGGFGAIDIKSGEMVIPAKFTEPFMFDRNGYAVVRDSSDSRLYGLIDLKGNYVIEPKYRWINPDGKDLYCVAEDSGSKGYRDVYKMSWVDSKGRQSSIMATYERAERGNLDRYSINAYLFGGREYFSYIQPVKDDPDHIYIKPFTLKSGPAIVGSVSCVLYPPVLRNGNSLANMVDNGIHKMILVDKNAHQVGDNFFYCGTQLLESLPSMIYDLYFYYTLGIPYVKDIYRW